MSRIRLITKKENKPTSLTKVWLWDHRVLNIGKINLSHRTMSNSNRWTIKWWLPTIGTTLRLSTRTAGKKTKLKALPQISAQISFQMKLTSNRWFMDSQTRYIISTLHLKIREVHLESALNTRVWGKVHHLSNLTINLVVTKISKVLRRINWWITSTIATSACFKWTRTQTSRLSFASRQL